MDVPLGRCSGGFSCFRDSHKTEPRHRYKAAYGHPTKSMACLAHSPDGIHRTPYNGGEPVAYRAGITKSGFVEGIDWSEKVFEPTAAG